MYTTDILVGLEDSATGTLYFYAGSSGYDTTLSGK